MEPESRSGAKPESSLDRDDPLYLSVCLYVRCIFIFGTTEQITMRLLLEDRDEIEDKERDRNRERKRNRKRSGKQNRERGQNQNRKRELNRPGVGFRHVIELGSPTRVYLCTKSHHQSKNMGCDRWCKEASPPTIFLSRIEGASTHDRSTPARRVQKTAAADVVTASGRRFNPSSETGSEEVHYFEKWFQDCVGCGHIRASVAAPAPWSRKPYDPPFGIAITTPRDYVHIKRQAQAGLNFTMSEADAFSLGCSNLAAADGRTSHQLRREARPVSRNAQPLAVSRHPASPAKREARPRAVVELTRKLGPHIGEVGHGGNGGDGDGDGDDIGGGGGGGRRATLGGRRGERRETMRGAGCETRSRRAVCTTARPTARRASIYLSAPFAERVPAPSESKRPSPAAAQEGHRHKNHKAIFVRTFDDVVRRSPF
ncbi:hypothetical protein EVAR_79954_1 [Eumeta japonica]|uniref:Uncharacterized protein n=1 Tax=Eumeta variegata TaxID=151549 RepID=A0A4C1Y2H9_EUMVA|nr:hypothetical protein EVAR_79954_1 [Eumeta japonica]